MIMESCKNRDSEGISNPVDVFESLDDSDIEKISKLNLNEEELSNVLSLFELIPVENKESAINILQSLFLNKKLVPIDPDENTKNMEEKVVRNISERYTRILLGE